MTATATSRFVTDQWGDLIAQLPPGLDALAAKHGLLKYRRCILDVSSLLRMGFAYSILDLSLRSVAAWGTANRVCKRMSDVAVMKQLQRLRPLVADLLQRMLDPRQDLANVPPGMTLVDGTSFGGPGSTGADWRINVSFSGSSGLSLGAELTTGAVSEHIEVSRLRPGDTVLGDRYYCQARTLRPILDAGADVLIRATRDLRLHQPGGGATSPQALSARVALGPGETLDEDVMIDLGAGRLTPMRLIVLRKTDEAADRALKVLRRIASKKQTKAPDSPEAIHGTQHVYLLTSVSRERATAAELATAYRFRWQIEISFKRWKSLLNLDDVRAKGELAQTYILCKLLAAALIEAALQEAAISPWGARFTRPAAQRKALPKDRRSPKAPALGPST